METVNNKKAILIVVIVVALAAGAYFLYIEMRKRNLIKLAAAFGPGKKVDDFANAYGYDVSDVLEWNRKYNLGLKDSEE